jgi:hypothetical protein
MKCIPELLAALRRTLAEIPEHQGVTVWHADLRTLLDEIAILEHQLHVAGIDLKDSQDRVQRRRETIGGLYDALKDARNERDAAIARAGQAELERDRERVREATAYSAYKMTEAACAQLREALVTAEAALSDIGDADHEPGDDLKWCERRAAKAIPAARAALATDAGARLLERLHLAEAVCETPAGLDCGVALAAWRAAKEHT